MSRVPGIVRASGFELVSDGRVYAALGFTELGHAALNFFDQAGTPRASIGLQCDVIEHSDGSLHDPVPWVCVYDAQGHHVVNLSHKDDGLGDVWWRRTKPEAGEPTVPARRRLRWTRGASKRANVITLRARACGPRGDGVATAGPSPIINLRECRERRLAARDMGEA